MKISLRFVSWLDILDILLGGIPYILFKLEEIKKSEVISPRQHIVRLLRRASLSPFFTFLNYYHLKSIGILTSILKSFLTIFKHRRRRFAGKLQIVLWRLPVSAVIKKEKLNSYINTPPVKHISYQPAKHHEADRKKKGSEICSCMAENIFIHPMIN